MQKLEIQAQPEVNSQYKPNRPRYNAYKPNYPRSSEEVQPLNKPVVPLAKLIKPQNQQKHAKNTTDQNYLDFNQTQLTSQLNQLNLASLKTSIEPLTPIVVDPSVEFKKSSEKF